MFDVRERGMKKRILSALFAIMAAAMPLVSCGGGGGSDAENEVVLPPSGSFVINGNAAYASTTAVTLDLSMVQNAAKMRFSNSESGLSTVEYENFTTSKSWNLESGIGSKTVYGEFVNKNGESILLNDEIIFDTTTPGGTFSINSGDLYVNSGAVVINLDSITDSAMMRFGNTEAERDAAEWEVFSTAKNWNLTEEDGTKTVYGEFKSTCGLINTISDTITLNSDVPGEVVNLQSSTNGTDSVTLTWEDPGSVDFNKVVVSYTPGGTENIEVNAGEQTCTIDGLAHGTEYTFTVRTIDVADNSSTGQDRTIRVNTVASWSTTAGLIGTSWDRYDTVVTKVEASDADPGDTVTYSVVAGELPAGVSLNSSTGDITGDPADVSEDTTYEFTINATDSGGGVVFRSFSITINYAYDGSDALRAAPSAQHLYDTFGISTSGAYWLQPLGLSAPLRTYCHFVGTTGYMLAARVHTSSGNWIPESSNWWNGYLLNEDQSFDPNYSGDIKNRLYTQFVATAVMFSVDSIPNSRVEIINSSLVQRFGYPLTLGGTHPLSYDWHLYVNWVAGYSYPGFPWSGGGFNYIASPYNASMFARVRYGMTFNNEGGPETADVAIGFGISKLEMGYQFGCGYIDTLTGQYRSTVGWMFVR